jgi:hypothetical protein
MSHEAKLEHLTVNDLAQKCAQETELFFAYEANDSSYCFELFRRAIRDSDERALELVLAQYQPLVARWVERWMSRHPNFSSATEEVQDFIAQTFERFWISFTPAKLDKSQGLPAVLRYLQMCVNGVLTDVWRKSQRLQLEQEMPEQERELAESKPTAEDLLQQEEFWQLIRRKSKDPREYLVIYASFHLALSPREILAEYPDQFKSVKEIYQYKANLLERLGRDEDIREFARRE